MLVSVLRPTQFGTVMLPAGTVIDLQEADARLLRVQGYVTIVDDQTASAGVSVAGYDASGNVIGLYKRDGTLQSLGGPVGAALVDDLETYAPDAALSARAGAQLQDDKAPKANPTFTGAVTVPEIADEATGTIAAPVSWVRRLFGTVQQVLPSGSDVQYFKGDKTLGSFAGDVRSTTATGLTTDNAQAPGANDSIITVLGKLARRAGDALTGLANKVDAASGMLLIADATPVVIDITGKPLPYYFTVSPDQGTTIRITVDGGSVVDTYDVTAYAACHVTRLPGEATPPTRITLQRVAGTGTLSSYTHGG